MAHWTIEAPTSLDFADVTALRSEFAELGSMPGPASRTVRGSLGAGSGHVSVNTMSGRVMLLRRAERRTAAQGARTSAPKPDNESEMEGEAS
jgi:hypothetical protein